MFARSAGPENPGLCSRRNTRKRLLRRFSLTAAALFSWSFVLAAPAQALANRPPAPPLRLRRLSPDEMQRMHGSQTSGPPTQPITPVTPDDHPPTGRLCKYLGPGIQPCICIAPGPPPPYQNPAPGLPPPPRVIYPGPPIGPLPLHPTGGMTNPNNGNRMTPVPIVGWRGRGGSVVNLTLAHNSEDSLTRMLGPKWTHSYDVYITFNYPLESSGPLQSVFLHTGTGLTVEYMCNADGTFATPTGYHDTLVRNIDNTFTLATPGSRLTYRFGTNNKLASISDTHGNQVSLAYNDFVQLQTVTDATGRAITFAYSGNNLATVTDPMKRIWSFTYDTGGNLQRVTYPTSGNIELDSVHNSPFVTFAYNAAHDINDIMDSQFHHTTLGYDSSDRLLWEQGACGNRVTRTYAADASSSTVTDPNGHTTTYTFSGNALTSYRDATGVGASYSYDANANRTGMTTPRGKTWGYSYDGQGNLLTVTDPFQHTSSATYNGAGMPLTVTDQLNHTTTLTYTANNDLLSITDALGTGHSDSFVGNPDGSLASISDANGHTAYFGYDANGNCNSAQDANGHTTTAQYNSLGWVTSITDANNNTVSVAYNAVGLPNKVTTPSGQTGIIYDSAGNVLNVVDANMHTATIAYDGDNRPLTVQKPNGDTIRLYWDGNQPGGGTLTGQKGLLSYMADGNGHATHYLYTVRNQVSEVDYPDFTAEGWSYDADGNVVAYGDGNHHITTLTYYDDGRLASSSANGGNYFYYDSAGRLTSINGTDGDMIFAYDAADRLTAYMSGQGGVNYAYDNGNRLTSYTLGPNQTTTYSYDNGNRLIGLTNPYNETTQFSYDSGDRLTQITQNFTAITTYAYDTRSRVTDIDHMSYIGNPIAHFSYTYDNVGNILTRTDSDGSDTTYTYDNSNQLLTEARTAPSGGFEAAYTYDHNSNRLSRTLTPAGGTAQTDTYSYDAHDKLLSVSGSWGSKSYGYDNNGSCTSVKVNNATTNTLLYDDLARLTTLTFAGGQPTAQNTFNYNAFGQRTQKIDSTGERDYLYSGPEPGSDLLASNHLLDYTYYTPGVSQHDSTGTKFFKTDLQGSTRAITNTAQTTTDTMAFDAFGQQIASTGTTATPFGFGGGSGYQTDKDSGLKLLGHRYYDSSIGRFLTQDPIGAGTNWYAYCDNNPVAYSDPTGLQGGPSISGPYYPIPRQYPGDWVPGGPDRGVGTDWLMACSNFSAGWGDALSDGGSEIVRRWLGVDGVVNRNSDDYRAGGEIAFAHMSEIGRVAGQGGGCFIDGTSVLLVDNDKAVGASNGDKGKAKTAEKDGATVSTYRQSIEKVKAGDQVVSRNEKTGKTEVKRVLKTTERTVDSVLTLTFADAKTGRTVETVTTTLEHPFYVDGKGFVPAGRLAIGNAVVTRAGPAVKVSSIEWQSRPEGYRVYNLVVEDDHTYFVGTVSGGLWVHNVEWCVHGVAPDWAVKGAHITYDGVELAVRPTAEGGIVFTPVFSGGGRAAETAATEAQELAQNGKFVAQLLSKVQSAKPYVLQYPGEGGVGRSAELHFLEIALRRLR